MTAEEILNDAQLALDKANELRSQASEILKEKLKELQELSDIVDTNCIAAANAAYNKIQSNL